MIKLMHLVVGRRSVSGRRFAKVRPLLLGLLSLTPALSGAQEPGVTPSAIRIGSTLALEGDIRNIGQGMKAGMEAALQGERVQNRAIELVAVNDFYSPPQTVKAVRQLIEQGIFVMLGSVGTPTAQAALPILAEHKVPAVGFYSATFTGPGDILHFRPSFAQEVASAIEAALAAGVKPQEVCVYAQNDSYGMSGVRGAVMALAQQPGMTAVVEKLNQIAAMPEPNPERNAIGPVGVYTRDTLNAKDGYASLKQWEKTANTKCRLVATVGTYLPIANFIGYAHYKGENWVFSVTTSAGGENLKSALREFKVSDKIIATQIVPPLNSPLPIVTDARKALGANLNSISLEGYVVGKLFLTIMRNIDGAITRENFLKAARKQAYDIGGLRVDYTTDNQGSDFVLLTYLTGDNYQPVTARDLEKVFQQ